MLPHATLRVRKHGLVVCCLVSAFANAAHAQSKVTDKEVREFSILVDGKEAGQSTMTITVKDDGTTEMTAAAKVHIRKVIFNYSFSIDSMEVWKDGKLIGMQNRSEEDGKKTEVVALKEGNQLKLRVNGKERLVNPESWVSSYWKLADQKFHNQKAPLIDSDTGKDMTGELKHIATEQITINGEAQKCYHFRITGIDVPIDLWFDRYHRLVRQEFTESGHKTIVQLINVKR
ncbi:MAG: hypothetical protein HY040_14505 [Planctomycetes bacterium]|nr:hypothetical protein [Planctomycetota bacterium]